jgi:spermidine/putrescine transport system substrate-binding protein
MATDRSNSGGAWRGVIAAFAVLALALGLAACGGGGGGGGSSEDAPTAKAGPVKGDLTISNWPGYIDPGEDGEEGTVAEFEKDTGVSVKYIEDVNDNEEFEGKLRPQLEQGDSGGRSIFVVTDWMAKQMYDEGFVQEINPDDLPTVFENMASNLRDPSFDPGRKFSIPWQSGMTGIWVDKSKAPGIKSINDLFDPKYKGKVTMLSEMRDTVALVMKAEGVDPAEATNEEWLTAIEKIDAAADSGQIRRFTGNEYNEDLNAGNVVASIGWSGDASIINNDNAEWIMPAEGCVLWSDNMVIPVGAPNTPAALGWMEFVYQPEVAVKLAEYITYVSPVEGIKELASPELAKNPLVFPTPEFQKDCSTQVSPPDVAEVEKAWQDVLTG